MIQVNVLDQYTCAFKCVHVNFMYYMSLQWGVRSTNDLTKKVNILWIPLQKSRELYIRNKNDNTKAPASAQWSGVRFCTEGSVCCTV